MKTYFFVSILALVAFSAFSQQAANDYYSKKLNELNKSIARENDNPALYYARADIYDELNDFQNANRDYIRVIELYQKHPDSKYAGEYAKSCYRLADDYFFRSSNREKALKYVRKGLEISSDFKDLEILEAVLMGLDSNMHDAAASKYKTLHEKYPDDIRLSMYYAKFLQASAPLSAAALYERVIATDPANKEALLSLGIIYNNEATRLSEGTVSDPAVVWDYAKKAIVRFEKLHKLNPSDKELANVLHHLYTELNEKGKAKMLEIQTPY